jgi:hypothetical protein
MNNRRIALGLGTGAGALLGAALLSGLTSPLAAADPITDTFAIDPVSATLVTDPTLTSFGGLGTDVITTEEYANFDTTPTTATLADNLNGFAPGSTTVVDTGATYLQATGGEGTEEVLTNTYSNPLFTDTSTDVTSAALTGVPGADADAGSLAGNIGVETDTILLDPSSGLDLGISLESVPSTTAGDAPTVTEDLITPLGNIPLGDGLTSLLGASDVSSLLGGGDLLAGLDPLSLLGSL